MAIKIVGAHGAPRVLPKRPVPGVPVVQPRAGNPSAARALAPHVQAAVSAIVQRRAAEPPRAPSPAPHVQAALRSAAPPATAKRNSPIQPSPAPRAATRVPAPVVVQCQLRIAEPQLQKAGYLDATNRLIKAARKDQRLNAVLDFAENDEGDLIIELGKPPDALAQTDFTINGFVISKPEDLDSFINKNGVKGLADAHFEIRIIIDKDKLLDQDDPRDFLQTLTHEYALHAAKFPSFIRELRSLASPSGAASMIERMRSGNMSANVHHSNLVNKSDEDYSKAKDLLDNLDNNFIVSEEKDIFAYEKINNLLSTKNNYHDLDQLAEKTNNLQQPLMFKQSPKKARSYGCCFLTTACVEAMGLPEDCHELNTLRSFRDGTLSALPDGAALIARYEEIAPGVVQWIRTQPDAVALFETIYFHVILPTVSLIEAGETAAAIELYGAAVEQLNQAF